MALRFEVHGGQIDGARDYQEDAFLITHLSDADGNPSTLVIMADGMGGHAAGNVASNMAVQAFNKHITSQYPTGQIAETLHGGVLKANSAIAETIKETPALQGMGCTMVAALVEKGRLWWASVGDSNLYLLRNRELQKKNADHSYGGFLDRMEAMGQKVEPEPGLARNMLMSAITGDDVAEIDCPEEPLELQPGDRVIVSSDGLDTLSDGKIIQFSEWSKTAKEYVEALLKAVDDEKMPRQDNTTVIVIDVLQAKEAIAEKPAPAQAAEPKLEIPAAAAAAPAAVPTYAPVEEREARKPPAVLWAGVAVVVLLIAGGVGYFLLKEPAPVPPPAAPEISEAPEPVPPAPTIVEPQVEPPPPPIPAAVEPAPAPAVAPAKEAAPAAPEVAPAKEAAVAATGPFRDTLKDGGEGPAMTWIPAGTFTMGHTGAVAAPEERPAHEVKIKRFAISQYEITFAEYEKFASATGRKIPDNLYLDKATHPVIFVSWDDAYYYAKWLSEQTGKKYRLPSEAEWEYAAGAGKTTPYWWGFDMPPNSAHCFGCGTGFDPRKPTKIGSFKPNPFSLYDVHGNVAEWVEDCWHPNYQGAPTDGSVWVGGDCVYRVVRGGSFSSPPPSLRTFKRDKFKSDATYDNIGFRVVREE